MKDTDPLPKGGYTRGFVAALAVSSVSFIAISTAFPSNPFPVVNTTTQAAVVAPVAVRMVPMDASQNVSLETTPSISAPAFGSPTTETSGLNVGVNSAAPSVTTVQPATLNAAADGTQVAVANTESVARPTAGLDMQTASVAQPVTEAGPTTLQPTLDVAAVATTEAALPPIPAVNLDGAFANNAQLFTDTGDRGLVSLVLKVNNIDDVRAAYSLAASVTLAIDVNNPDAAYIASAYRQVGGETLLLVPAANGFRNGETSDVVATRLSSLMPKSMEVIGMIDPSGNAVPNDKLTINSVLGTLSPSGHAIVSTAGSEAVLTAQQAGIPAITFAAELKSTEDQGTIIASIEQALTGVSQTGSTVIYGTADKTTIAALSSWLASTAASQVTMAPVSAAINRN